MKANECKIILDGRALYLKDQFSKCSPLFAGIGNEIDALNMAIKIIEVFEESLQNEGAFIVEYKDGNLKLNIGGKEYEI